MKQNFKTALEAVLKHEGGFVDHPKDPGGATNKGITLKTFCAHINPNATVDDLCNISDGDVQHIYKEEYWDRVRGDDLPSGLDYAVFDFAVNSGWRRAAKRLQMLVGAKADGMIGKNTLREINRRNAQLLTEALCNNRLYWLQTLKHWETFGKGWARRVDEVKTSAIELTRF